jgi:hypothetical protein
MGKAELAETLDGLRRPLADVFVLVGRITGDEHLTRELSAAHEALGRVADGLRDAPPNAPADIAAVWLHDVCGWVNSMVGWSKVLVLRRANEATRLRAVEAIERNAKLLMESLSRPPV